MFDSDLPEEEWWPPQVEMYVLRGQTVAITGRIEWCIAQLAAAFTASTDRNAGRRWDAIKAELVKRGLNSDLQEPLAQVAAYFTPRHLAAHATIVMVTSGENVYPARLAGTFDNPVMDILGFDDLRAERDLVIRAHSAVQVVGRALDEHDPAVLGSSSELFRGILLNRPEPPLRSED